MSHTPAAYAYNRAAASMALFGLQNRHYIGLKQQSMSIRSALAETMPGRHPEREYADAFSLIADFLPGNALDEPLSGFNGSDLENRLDSAARHANNILEKPATLTVHEKPLGFDAYFDSLNPVLVKTGVGVVIPGVKISSPPPMTPDEMYNARKALGLSIRELSALIGVNPRTITRMESQAGRTLPNSYVSEKLRVYATDGLPS